MTSPLNLTRRGHSGPITPEANATSAQCFDLCSSQPVRQAFPPDIRRTTRQLASLKDASGPDRDCSGRSAANVTTIRPPRRSRSHVEPTTDPERDGPAATTQNLLFRRVMVGPVVAISLAKPSKPADEEKFALLLSAGSNRRLPRRDSTNRARTDGRNTARRSPTGCSRCISSNPVGR